MSDIAETVAPNSDQITADDLRAGPWTITVTSVRVNKAEDQPVSIFYENCGKKPFKPCKTMRRVLLELWGPNSIEYVGKTLTVYRDANVSFGKDKTGGVRISHLSHIPEQRQVSVITTKGRRGLYLVKPLRVDIQTLQERREYEAKPSNDAVPDVAARANAWVDKTLAEIGQIASMGDLEAFTGSSAYMNGMKAIRPMLPDRAAEIDAAVQRSLGVLGDPFAATA
ncbi:hypothetical protein AA103196_0996 [Ameyamaea chiangmaiensis NBRC 103196]|uniref:Uncharacterized protein n=1 Tax=Ameyamaea chiangmaiensis TaxID=442969 RepID=A0A850P619_9PROT|nr:hypothetical protein [Ameyamaea chiangmaiensis]MBS4074622.1 hypothetical protein [Ameyamaea chiangmaiensis]NVN39378.1 hypothetical protein [Ameyamaea chiangmaiensis]GBQ64881.1 hypothetical protein AA103196_0996 [Ameyamaea chiangmaiensis NBRC 103196]